MSIDDEWIKRMYIMLCGLFSARKKNKFKSVLTQMNLEPVQALT